MVVFIGREKELAMLNQAYLKGGNSIVVLYGREQIGKTTLVKKFVQDKTYVYYQARELSEKEQNRYFEKALFSVKEKAEKERLEAEERQRAIQAGEIDDFEGDDEYVDVYCPHCGEELSYMKWQINEGNLICPMCDKECTYSEEILR